MSKKLMQCVDMLKYLTLWLLYNESIKSYQLLSQLTILTATPQQKYTNKRKLNWTKINAIYTLFNFKAHNSVQVVDKNNSNSEWTTILTGPITGLAQSSQHPCGLTITPCSVRFSSSASSNIDKLLVLPPDLCFKVAGEGISGSNGWLAAGLPGGKPFVSSDKPTSTLTAQ